MTCVSEGPGRSVVNLRALDVDGTVSALPLRRGFLIIEKSQRVPGATHALMTLVPGDPLRPRSSEFRFGALDTVGSNPGAASD